MYTKQHEMLKERSKFADLTEAMMKGDEDLYCEDEKIRSRAVHNPPFEYKIYGGTLNSNLLKATKKVNPHFVSGLNISELSSLIQTRANNIDDCVFVSLDGVAHDSH